MYKYDNGTGRYRQKREKKVWKSLTANRLTASVPRLLCRHCDDEGWKQQCRRDREFSGCRAKAKSILWAAPMRVSIKSQELDSELDSILSQASRIKRNWVYIRSRGGAQGGGVARETISTPRNKIIETSRVIVSVLKMKFCSPDSIAREIQLIKTFTFELETERAKILNTNKLF